MTMSEFVIEDTIIRVNCDLAANIVTAISAQSP